MKNKKSDATPKVRRVAVVVGSYRVLVTHQEFLAWERRFQDQHGFAPAAILKAIRERLGL